MYRAVLTILLVFIIGGFQSSATLELKDDAKELKNGSAMLFRNSEQLYKSSIEYLNEHTPIELQYSVQTKRFIDRYIIDNPDQFATIMGRSQYYFPLFEEKLANSNLPLELKNIAIIESALNPLAVSKSGAAGLWQFMFHTSKMFNLKIDSYVDERRDPIKSTDAACNYLKYLYRIFNDWQLAITAYNGGPGMIEMAIEKSGGKTDYWDIRPYLTREAQNYYPTFVAACYASRFYKRHDIKVNKSAFAFNDVEVVSVKKSLWFKQVAAILNISVPDLRMLNPAYKQNYVPVFGDPVRMVLPKSVAKDFVRRESEIYACKVETKNYLDLRAEVGATHNRTMSVHHVERGQYFHTIAMNYGCTIYDIMAWNSLKTKSLNVGQALNIYTLESVEDSDIVTKLKVVELPNSYQSLGQAELNNEFQNQSQNMQQVQEVTKL